VLAKTTVQTLMDSAQSILTHTCGLYLYYRSKMPLDAHPYLPSRLNDMVRYLAEGLGIDKEGEQDNMRSSLCKELGRTMDKQIMFNTLMGVADWEDFDGQTGNLDMAFGGMDRLVARATLRLHDLVEKVMKSCDWSLCHPIFVDLLEQACRDG
jgi:hypothetical protein